MNWQTNQPNQFKLDEILKLRDVKISEEVGLVLLYKWAALGFNRPV